METVKAGPSQRIFAWALARFNKRYEKFVSRYKRQLFSDVAGTVLEIGPGTGVNLRYLEPDRVRWIGIETNPFMHAYLREEAERTGVRISIISGAAGELPIRDASVDAAISTLVLCCVPDQRRCLAEIRRVLKPGGRLLFIEHVAAPRGTRLRWVQSFVAPVWKRLGDGCHPDRETAAELERAGFAKVKYRRITAPIPVVGPQVVGTAAK